MSKQDLSLSLTTQCVTHVTTLWVVVTKYCQANKFLDFDYFFFPCSYIITLEASPPSKFACNCAEILNLNGMNGNKDFSDTSTVDFTI